MLVGTLLTAQLVTLVVLTLVARSLARARQENEELRGQLAQNPSRTRKVVGRAVQTVVGTADRVRERGLVGGLLMAPMEELVGWFLEDRDEIVRVAGPDGTVTILFSDIEDSTSLNEELGDATWVRLLSAHDKIVRAQVGRHHGHIVKSQGDGFMVVFGDPADAVRAALAIQQGISSPGRRLRRTPLRIRIGVHAGTAVAREGDYFGRNVALAARVAARARGGQILLTEEVRSGLTGSELTLTPAGEFELKGLAGVHPLWTVS